MLSTSFLRTLNLKKHQDCTEENRNRLRVYYIRTINKINREARMNSQNSKPSHVRIPTQKPTRESFNIDNRANMKENKPETQDGRLIGGRRTNTAEKNSTQNSQILRQPYESHNIKNIALNIQATRLLCQKRIQNIEKQSFMEGCKIACLNRGRKTVGRRERPLLNFLKPSTPRFH